MNSAIVVGLKEDVLEGGRVVVDVDGVEIGIFRIDGRLYAWENRCVHAGGPVCQGKLMPRVVERLDAGKRSLGDDFSDELHIVCPVARLRVRRADGRASGQSALAAARRRRRGARG